MGQAALYFSDSNAFEVKDSSWTMPTGTTRPERAYVTVHYGASQYAVQMNRTVILLGICITAFEAATAMSSEPVAQTSELILTRIRNEGPAAVLQSLWDKQVKWNELTDKIATGQKGWVDVAVALAPGSDAGATSELKDALFAALGHNPRYVLRVLPVEESDQSPLALSEICRGRDDPPSTYAASVAEQKRTEAAVEQVSDKVLEPKKLKCLAKLRSGEGDLKRFFEVP